MAQGVNKLGDKLPESKCALVYGQMNEPPGARARVALTGTGSHLLSLSFAYACALNGLSLSKLCMAYD